MELFNQIKILLRIKRVVDQVKKEGEMGYDLKKTLVKAGVEFLKSGGAVALVAVLGWLSDNSVITGILQHAGFSTAITALLVPAVHAGVEAAQNYLKHGSKVETPAETPVAPVG